MKGGNDERNTISSRTSIRLNIGFVAGGILGFGLYLFAETQILRHSAKEDFKTLHATIETKADKGQALDRYTGTQATEFKESVKQRFSAAEKLNTQKYITINNRVDDLIYDVNILKNGE